MPVLKCCELECLERYLPILVFVWALKRASNICQFKVPLVLIMGISLPSGLVSLKVPHLLKLPFFPGPYGWLTLSKAEEKNASAWEMMPTGEFWDWKTSLRPFDGNAVLLVNLFSWYFCSVSLSNLCWPCIGKKRAGAVINSHCYVHRCIHTLFGQHTFTFYSISRIWHSIVAPLVSTVSTRRELPNVWYVRVYYTFETIWNFGEEATCQIL